MKVSEWNPNQDLCESCLETSDGIFLIEDLFFVELCSACARELRSDLFGGDQELLDAVSGIIQHRVAEATANRVIKGDDDASKAVLTSIAYLALSTRNNLYEAIKGWLNKGRKWDLK